MESVICALLLVLVLLMYFSGRKNLVNRRGAFAGFLFWLGLAKEAIAYNLIPLLERTLGVGLSAGFMLPYSLMTWSLYALAVPESILFALALGDSFPPPGRRSLFYLPAAVISCVYLPWEYPAYQAGNTGFWITFAVYNILGCGVFAFMMIRSVRREADATARIQKRLVVGALLPPVLFWVLSVFLTHPFKLTYLNKLWQLNALVLLASVVFFLVVAFHGGMMGLRLTSEPYRWNSDMGLIRRGASYTKHMIKNQTAKMAWCVENLRAQLGQAPPEELDILSRAIETIKNYTEKAEQYADVIVLDEATHSLDEMLRDAFALCAGSGGDGASLRCMHTGGICLRCDPTHMTEVFLNLFNNALDAMETAAPIEVNATPGRGAFTLRISDHGRGISRRDVAHIFEPYYTTKVSSNNLGLGLAYCKNVIQRHGGALECRSKQSAGTTMIIRLPANRVVISQADDRKGATRHA